MNCFNFSINGSLWNFLFKLYSLYALYALYLSTFPVKCLDLNFLARSQE